MSWLDERRNEFTWSHSRAVLFDECARKYYWRYYAPYGGNAPWETRDRFLLYQLGRLTYIPILIGNIIHDLARDSLRRAQEGHRWAPSSLVATARERLAAALRRSKQAVDRPPARPETAMPILDAHYYRRPLAEGEEDTAVENVARYARNLNEHPTYLDAMEHAGDLLSVDHFDRFVVFEGPGEETSPPKPKKRGQAPPPPPAPRVEAHAVPDAIQRCENGSLRIIDWKTGTTIEASMDKYTDQLAVYALYASRKWGLGAAQIAAQVADLHTGEVIAVPLTDDDLRGAEGRIMASVMLMEARLRDRALNQAHIESFPMLAPADAPYAAVPTLCRRCAFRLPCYGERVFEW